eukprot:CAMPEP_0201557504 /NCGR_PEP_ID=MMETSP0173_2-20130828/62271_1 /ASSEMBLY_ACC=CAM_ASM_000268 /TAXON_ID=218659 /ORGANISM="Vexillifera sp., Strain DIVA3 564/2" /LENGTH=634 /DNA_ID=CAMNT_0047970381 /DNA_START=384 /DNA_END=2288 /DNA_ORIENTATION=+
MGFLADLTHLYLSGLVELSQLPDCFRSLKNLKYLDISRTNIATPPASVRHVRQVLLDTQTTPVKPTTPTKRHLPTDIHVAKHFLLTYPNIEELSLSQRSSSMRVNTMCVAHSRYVWFGTTHGRVGMFDLSFDSSQDVVPGSALFLSLPIIDQEHAQRVESIVYDAKNQLIWSGSCDGTIAIWPSRPDRVWQDWLLVRTKHRSKSWKRRWIQVDDKNGLRVFKSSPMKRSNDENPEPLLHIGAKSILPTFKKGKITIHDAQSGGQTLLVELRSIITQSTNTSSSSSSTSKELPTTSAERECRYDIMLWFHRFRLLASRLGAQSDHAKMIANSSGVLCRIDTRKTRPGNCSGAIPKPIRSLYIVDGRVWALVGISELWVFSAFSESIAGSEPKLSIHVLCKMTSSTSRTQPIHFLNVSATLFAFAHDKSIFFEMKQQGKKLKNKAIGPKENQTSSSDDDGSDDDECMDVIDAMVLVTNYYTNPMNSDKASSSRADMLASDLFSHKKEIWTVSSTHHRVSVYHVEEGEPQTKFMKYIPLPPECKSMGKFVQSMFTQVHKDQVWLGTNTNQIVRFQISKHTLIPNLLNPNMALKDMSGASITQIVNHSTTPADQHLSKTIQVWSSSLDNSISFWEEEV